MNKLSNHQRRFGARFFAQPIASPRLDTTISDGQTGELPRAGHAAFWRRFRPLFTAGLVGVAALVPVVHSLVEASIAKLPAPPRISPAALTALSLIQPTILMTGAVALGAALAPRLGLRSHLADRATSGRRLLAALSREAPLAATLGSIAALGIIVGDLALRPLLGAQIEPLLKALPHNTLSITVAGVLAGGIYEELLMRWGLMTLLAWAGWRLFQQGRGLPRRGVMIGAIVVSALLFGAGHLPATAMLVPLTPLVILRALLLNGLAALAYGWLFWRRSLEAAMLAHATSHVVFTIVSSIASFGH